MCLTYGINGSNIIIIPFSRDDKPNDIYFPCRIGRNFSFEYPIVVVVLRTLNAEAVFLFPNVLRTLASFREFQRKFLR